jgi:hypothetical protein
MTPVQCVQCGAVIDDEIAHLAHEQDCMRFVDGICRCDLWVCAACCRECEPSPLARRLAAVNQLPQRPPFASTRGLVKRRSPG